MSNLSDAISGRFSTNNHFDSRLIRPTDCLFAALGGACGIKSFGEVLLYTSGEVRAWLIACLGSAMGSAVEKICIEQFRMFHGQEFALGEKLTAILGQNGTMKTTLLGMIGEPFRFEKVKDSEGNAYKVIGGGFFQMKFNDAFKFSDGPNGFERAGDHRWDVVIDSSVYPDVRYPARTIPRTNIATNDIRTWAGDTKTKGKSHVQFPCIYLSLKRLVPIGEEKNVAHEPIDLSQKEKDWFEKHYKRILLLRDEMKDAELVHSSNKNSIGFVTERYDSLTNSAGQDNVGKILLSVLSFARLKQAMGVAYKGGLLLIDEIDATLYPAAQKKLIEFLLKAAGDLDLQVVFTTHSPDTIEVLYDVRYADQCKVVYLETKDGETDIYENLPLANVIAHLRAEIVSQYQLKIRVLAEDDSTRMFMKPLVPSGLRGKLEYMKIELGHGDLNNLRKTGLRDFQTSIIVYDGDVNISRATYAAANAVALPGGAAPEVVLFQFLKNLSERDSFWADVPGGYSKQICFAGYESFDGNDSEMAKKWFAAQKSNFGRGCVKAINRWKDDHAAEVEAFQVSLKKAFMAVGGTI